MSCVVIYGELGNKGWRNQYFFWRTPLPPQPTAVRSWGKSHSRSDAGSSAASNRIFWASVYPTRSAANISLLLFSKQAGMRYSDQDPTCTFPLKLNLAALQHLCCAESSISLCYQGQTHLSSQAAVWKMTTAAASVPNSLTKRKKKKKD